MILHHLFVPSVCLDHLFASSAPVAVGCQTFFPDAIVFKTTSAFCSFLCIYLSLMISLLALPLSLHCYHMQHISRYHCDGKHICSSVRAPRAHLSRCHCFQYNVCHTGIRYHYRFTATICHTFQDIIVMVDMYVLVSARPVLINSHDYTHG